jgi:DNA-binding CsgD family transcriptional regulator
LADNNLADYEMRRRVALIAPHLRRAILIGEAIDQKAKETTIFVDILNSLRAGLFLIDSNGQIVHANAAGRGILAANDVLCTIGGRLVARDAAFNHALRDIFAGTGDSAIGGNGFALPLTARDGECQVAHILPLGEGARDRIGAPNQVVAAVFVCEAALEISSSADVIQRAFQLTPTELRVLFAIVNVGGIPQVAAALGVAVSTIKTHVGRIYDKTGAVRQADLVKLVVGFLNPLVA